MVLDRRVIVHRACPPCRIVGDLDRIGMVQPHKKNAKPATSTY
jgi:hypothetical protein